MFTSLRGYDRGWLRGDLVAGLTVWESMPYMDVSAARVLAELTEDLEQRGVQLFVARDLGQVRDVVRRSGESAALQLYPTVEAALDAVRHSDGGDAR